jgi:hypothetical protein
VLALARDIRQKRINRASDGREEPGYDPFMCTAAEPTGPCSDLIRWLDQHDAPAVRMITDGASLPAWRAVPETISISGTAVQISADLWRDFMPSPSPRSRTSSPARTECAGLTRTPLTLTCPARQAPDAAERVAASRTDQIQLSTRPA